MKRYRFITGTVLAALIAYGLFGVYSVSEELEEARKTELSLKTQISQTETENSLLTAKIESIGTDEAIKALAHERLGLVLPDEVVFEDAD